jgi:hypothetical protein
MITPITKNTTINSHTERARYFALVSGHVVALSVALVFGLTLYAQVDPVFKRSMAFMFGPALGNVQVQAANTLSTFGL